MNKPDSKAMRRTVLYGSFKGTGDLLNAAPVVRSLLDSGHQVRLLCFPWKTLLEFVDMVDFGPQRGNLSIVALPAGSGVTGMWRLLRLIAQIDPDVIWISPHASRRSSSWRVPLTLWIAKWLCAGVPLLAGAESERLSFLFDMPVAVDRSLPLAEREWAAFAPLSEFLPLAGSRLPAFIERIRREAAEPCAYDLLIHPGANAQNRSWPFASYRELVGLLPSSCRIAALGLTQDMAQLEREMPSGRGIVFLSGTLEQALVSIAQARVVLTMDSGNVHFANALGVPTVALFGKTDPTRVLAPGGSVLPIYERHLPCQPCERVTCSQPRVYCMESIAPKTVAAALLGLLDAPRRADASPRTA